MWNNKRVCVDFDGTIFMPAYPAVGALRSGALEALQTLRAEGWEIVIGSCRTSALFCKDSTERRQKWLQMKQALDAHNVPYDYIDDGTVGKVVASVYLDDRAVSAKCWREALEKTRQLGSFFSTMNHICNCPGLENCKDCNVTPPERSGIYDE